MLMLKSFAVVVSIPDVRRIFVGRILSGCVLTLSAKLFLRDRSLFSATSVEDGFWMAMSNVRMMSFDGKSTKHDAKVVG
jgi:hypothetical protein